MDQVISAYSLPGIPRKRGVKKAVMQLEARNNLRLIEYILEELCEVYDVPFDWIRNTRRQQAVYVKQLFSYYIHHHYPEIVLRTISFYINKTPDHATAIHSINTFADRLSTDAALPRALKSNFEKTREDYLNTITHLKTKIEQWKLNRQTSAKSE